MVVLGLHFGHDASVSVVADGELLVHALRERHSRVKKAVGLDAEIIQNALTAAGLTLADIDACALVSTQDLELLTGLVEGFELELGEDPNHPVASPLVGLLADSGIDPHTLLTHGLRRLFERAGDEVNPLFLDRWKRMLPEWERFAGHEIASHGWLDLYTTHESWYGQRGLQGLAGPLARGALDDPIRLGMHYPVRIRLFGHTLPGYFVDHHVCHGASTYYRSGFEQAAILSVDGGNPSRNLSGHFMLGQGSRLHVIAPHHLALGGLYRNVGVALGFDALGAEGKLMGLSSYGQPRFYRDAFTGNLHDLQRRHGTDPFRSWMKHCLELAAARGYDQQYGNAESVLGPLSVDIAASTQKLFEETWLRAAEVLDASLRASGLGTDQLCVTGGCALNCPANSRLYVEGPFSKLFVEPNCDDGGLSVGAALYLYHNGLGRPVDPVVAERNRSPYRGIPVDPADTDQTLKRARGSFQVSQPANPGQAAAGDLHEDRILAWFEGRSEMGPRALCHRSVLANPANADNWRRVNQAKGRETWRPFAPVVLEEAMTDWFADCPTHSPYMLFTARVKSRQLPAVTHVDGSARIQTVTPDNGGIHDVLTELEKHNGAPVLMNTSLNGPGEPIVEQPSEALSFFENSGIDVLYIDGMRIARR